MGLYIPPCVNYIGPNSRKMCPWDLDRDGLCNLCDLKDSCLTGGKCEKGGGHNWGNEFGDWTCSKCNAYLDLGRMVNIIFGHDRPQGEDYGII